MTQYLEGPLQPFQTIDDRRKLVGRAIRYIRDRDIDRSGRGIPQTGIVLYAEGVYLILDRNRWVSRNDLVEVEFI